MTWDLRRPLYTATSLGHGVEARRVRGTDLEAVFDDVPHEVVRAARQAYERRDWHVVVADIVDDQQANRTVQRLTFAGPHRYVTVGVRVLRGLLGLSVEVQPSAPLTVHARHRGTELMGRCDARGRCYLAPVHPGPVSLLLSEDQFGADRPVATAWTIM